jgi:hypothetical protein
VAGEGFVKPRENKKTPTTIIKRVANPIIRGNFFTFSIISMEAEKDNGGVVGPGGKHPQVEPG